MRQYAVKLMNLTFYEWYVLLYSMFLLPIIALVIQRKGYKEAKGYLQEYVSGQKIHKGALDEQLKVAQVTARMVSVAARFGFYRANCLKRALALWWLLTKVGIDSKIKIGVSNQGGVFSAHAWVEHQGIVLADSKNIEKKFSTLLVE